MAACGGDDTASVKVADFDAIPADVLPATVLDLGVSKEEFSATLLSGQEPYIKALGMFGLRRGDLLQATVQVSQSPVAGRAHRRERSAHRQPGW